MIQLKIDTQIKTYSEDVTWQVVAEEYQKEYADEILLVQVNGKLQELQEKIPVGRLESPGRGLPQADMGNIQHTDSKATDGIIKAVKIYQYQTCRYKTTFSVLCHFVDPDECQYQEWYIIDEHQLIVCMIKARCRKENNSCCRRCLFVFSLMI